MADLLTAIGTLSTKLIPNSTGDKRRAYVVRLADYSHRLLFAEVPQLAIEKTADEATVDEPLSSDLTVAIIQLLKATGVPDAHPETPAYEADPAAVLAKATPEQNAELALLGFFGQPNTGPTGADFTLFNRYYHQNPDGNWALNDPNQDPWKAYLASKGA